MDNDQPSSDAKKKFLILIEKTTLPKILALKKLKQAEKDDKEGKKD
ncbi:hypothetical protein HPT25_23735 [Bacillus sp. BRMEA1]|nr:hypothetical protein [Neobacillus endophyticus]NRD80337.1 hypothetical protein [Neobacillus endophyticus]